MGHIYVHHILGAAALYNMQFVSFFLIARMHCRCNPTPIIKIRISSFWITIRDCVDVYLFTSEFSYDWILKYLFWQQDAEERC